MGRARGYAVVVVVVAAECFERDEFDSFVAAVLAGVEFAAAYGYDYEQFVAVGELSESLVGGPYYVDEKFESEAYSLSQPSKQSQCCFYPMTNMTSKNQASYLPYHYPQVFCSVSTGADAVM